MSKGSAKKIAALNVLDEKLKHLASVATISHIDESGAVFIEQVGTRSEPIQAQLSLCEADQVRLRNASSVSRVLVLDTDNAAGAPVIIGLLSDELVEAPQPDEVSEEDVVHLDVSALKLEAKTELILLCGKSQITMKADGRIILRGTDVISRSSGPNRIRGATVRIN